MLSLLYFLVFRAMSWYPDLQRVLISIFLITMDFNIFDVL